jgi:TPR repeat protein
MVNKLKAHRKYALAIVGLIPLLMSCTPNIAIKPVEIVGEANVMKPKLKIERKETFDCGLSIRQSSMTNPEDFDFQIRSDPKGIEEYRVLANKGDRLVQLKLAIMYEAGVGNDVIKSPSESMKWYKTAAEQGCALAQTLLGSKYEEGIGVKKDGAEAIRWYKKAGEQGDALALFQIGGIYFSGNGVVQSNKEAIKWYEKAAAKGSPNAKIMLERMHGNM